jgi:predicted ATPase
VLVKGLDDPVEAFEVLGSGAVRTRLEAAAARGLTPFVGRRAERDVIAAALARARDGHGQVVALVGEPGVGKSRLVREAVRSQAADGWGVLEAGAVSYGATTPYLPIVGLLRSWCGSMPTDPPTAVGLKLTAQLRTLDPVLDDARPPLLALVDAPVDDADWWALDPPRRRRRTLDAVMRVLLRESRERPILLVVEDLHWIDAESQALLDELVDTLQGARLLLLVNYRPEYSHGWGSKSMYSQIRIDPLETASAEQLLLAQLGDGVNLDPLKRHLLTRTGGNPLFLEESVRSLVETGVLLGQPGAYTLARDVREVRMPTTVQAILAARIDRLDPEAKRLLQTAAVVGKDVPLALLRAVADERDDSLHDLLARLQSADLLYPLTLFPEPEYTFKHALTHEVAYGSLLQERRRAIHASVVAAVERIYADRLDERTELLAHHALCGAAWKRAVCYCRRAAARASSRSAYAEASEWNDRAIEALSHLPESDETLALSVDLRLDLRNSLPQRSEQARFLDYLRDAEQFAASLNDHGRLADVYALMH